MQPRQLAAIAVSPAVSYAVMLAAVFIGTIVAGQLTVSEASKSLLLILLKSFSLGHLCLYLIAALPAAAVPGLLQLNRPGSARFGVPDALRWLAAIVLMSALPTIFCLIIMAPVQALLIGLAAGGASVAVCFVVSRPDRPISAVESLATIGKRDPGEPWRSPKPTSAFGRRGL